MFWPWRYLIRIISRKLRVRGVPALDSHTVCRYIYEQCRNTWGTCQSNKRHNHSCYSELARRLASRVWSRERERERGSDVVETQDRQSLLYSERAAGRAYVVAPDKLQMTTFCQTTRGQKPSARAPLASPNSVYIYMYGRSRAALPDPPNGLCVRVYVCRARSSRHHGTRLYMSGTETRRAADISSPFGITGHAVIGSFSLSLSLSLARFSCTRRVGAYEAPLSAAATLHVALSGDFYRFLTRPCATHYSLAFNGQPQPTGLCVPYARSSGHS
ncbi:unnamed protein product [Trichogramma brassicae]|uniref:Uncharacterized protein n=1 Tax=Trichogramma brassicae TaxID=86971 RepID=A0A6H5J9E4_9HYME|nr:unnamed protein product [Trichogramma brassicae]